jgi:thiamine kinase
LHMDVHAGNIVHTSRAQADRLGICRRRDVALELAAVWTEDDAARGRSSGLRQSSAH